MNIAAWQFFGPNRVAEVVLGNGLICTYMNNTRTRSAMQAGQSSPSWGNAFNDRLGYDGVGRPITKRYLAGGIDPETHEYLDTTPVVGFTTAYDKVGNKFYERVLHAESRSHLFQPFSAGEPTGGYDSADRLRQYQRGVLSTTGGSGNQGGGSITTPISLPNANESAQYDLDGLGNWRRFTADPVGGSASTQIRQHNGLNQITRTTVSSTNTNFSYDGQSGASNGNLADDGLRLYKWDALNRLKEVRRKSDNAAIGQYDYDALNRRVRKVISNGGLSGTIGNRTELHSYSGWRCVEEDWSTLKFQYVWGIYLDEIVQVKIGVSSFYPLQDLLYRTTAFTEPTGAIAQALDYDAYGNTLIFSAAGTGGNWWANDATQSEESACPFLFTGQRYDPESEIYYYKRRYYHPPLGRFVGRDPIGYSALDFNLYCYARGCPVAVSDPSGLFFQKPGKDEPPVDPFLPKGPKPPPKPTSGGGISIDLGSQFLQILKESFIGEPIGLVCFNIRIQLNNCEQFGMKLLPLRPGGCDGQEENAKTLADLVRKANVDSILRSDCPEGKKCCGEIHFSDQRGIPVPVPIPIPFDEPSCIALVLYVCTMKTDGSIGLCVDAK